MLEFELNVNGERRAVRVEARKLLSDVLREDCRLTGTHVGCEHGVCGACTVLVDGRPARACLIYAVQMQGHEITTIEAVAEDGKLEPRAAGAARGARSAVRLLHRRHRHDLRGVPEENPHPSEAEIREVLSGNLCRCTGYHNIVAAILKAADAEKPPGSAISARALARKEDLPFPHRARPLRRRHRDSRRSCTPASCARRTRMRASNR